MNEATLEARIHDILKSVFPTFREVNLVHQKSFTFKFGHHEVKVDHSDPSKYGERARLDILLTIEGKNVILLELKRPGHSIQQDDVDQGISYARLLHPIPPLTVVSNGKVNVFYNSYTKEALNTSTADLHYLQQLTDNTFQVASEDLKSAIELLLNKDSSFFNSIVNTISRKRFETMIGGVNDLQKPICADFQVPRTVVEHIEKFFDEATPILGVVGQAFSGKTNVLFQFFEKQASKGNFVLYVNCSDHNYHILQNLANEFTRHTQTRITPDKVREWILNSLNQLEFANFYLLLDNFNPDINETLKVEAIELIDIFQGRNRVLYTADEYNFKNITFIKDRSYKTIIGEKSKICSLSDFDENEFEQANQLMYKTRGVYFAHGSDYTVEYRQPRVLRFLASIHRSVENEGAIRLFSVPNLNLLKQLVQSPLYTQNTKDLYKKLAHTFVAERTHPLSEPNYEILAHGRGAVLLDTYKQLYPSDNHVQLEANDAIITRMLPSGKKVIIPKFSDLTAYYVIDVITERIKTLSTNPDAARKLLLDLVSAAPFNDIVGAGVLMKLGDSETVDLFSQIVLGLLNSPPTYQKVNSNTKVLMRIDDQRQIELDVHEGESISVDSYLPFLILSQLAFYPLNSSIDEETVDYDFHLQLLWALASHNDILRRVDTVDFHRMKPYHGHEIGQLGFIVSGSIGIIEPIVNALQVCFMSLPDKMDEFINEAFTHKNFFVLWRLYLGLRELVETNSQIESERAKTFVDTFLKFFNQYMAELLTKDIEDVAIRQSLKNKLLGFYPDAFQGSD